MIEIRARVHDEPGITLDRVQFAYDEAPILRDVNWELGRGRSAVVTGGNGCGKSTLLYIASGLLPPRRGTVLLEGHSVASMLPSSRVRKGLRVGFVFQEGGLLANLGTFANVALPLRYHHDIFDLDDEQIAQRAEEALDTAQVNRSYWEQLPAHLSFGMRKRLALARAIAIRPNYFFFDDPDVGMDPQTARVTHQMLCQLRDDPDVTLLVATNRSILIERLEVPGFRLQDGRLTARSAQESMPPSWPTPDIRRS